MSDREIENLATQAEATIRHKALVEASEVAEIWAKTEAVLDPAKTDNPQMALVIATVTRTTARKIKEGILALMGQKPESKVAKWSQVTCDCNADSRSCLQGKLDYGQCTIWVKNG